MKHLLFLFVFVYVVVSCESNPDKINHDKVIDLLTIKYSGKADSVQFEMIDGLSQHLNQDSISGTYGAVLSIPNLMDAVFSYEIVLFSKDSIGQMFEMQPSRDLLTLNNKKAIEKNERFLWIGDNRSYLHLDNNDLQGTITSKKVKSDFLGEEREITIYRPTNVGSDIPLIYFTDGMAVKSYAPYVDYLINTKRISPVQLVGVHSSRSNRYKEYVKGADGNEAFVNHEKFFFQEVMPIVEQDIPNWNGKRYIYGFSNGAAFCMYAGLNKLDMFEEVIAFSIADYITPMAQMINPIKFKLDQYPKFYMGAGKYETSIYRSNRKFVKKMKKKKIDLNFKEFIAGHDSNVWHHEFMEYAEKRFNTGEL